VGVAGVLGVLAVRTTLALVPVRLVLHVRVALVQVVEVCTVLHRRVPAAGVMRVFGVFGVLLMAGLGHEFPPTQGFGIPSSAP
jgi:hypothetical protein